MRKMGRMMAWVLSIALFCSGVPLQASASELPQYAQTVPGGDAVMEAAGEEYGSVSGSDMIQTGLGDEISMRGQSSFGMMLANELSAEVTEQRENNGCNVFSVEIQGEMAIVSLETVEDAVLVIGIYDETGNEMVTSGNVEVYAGETDAVVEFEPGSLPQYFYVRGFLVDFLNYRPLCTVYESPMYTQEMQEFLARTTADFDSDRVLNLDEDETNNFAVFGEDTIRISGEEGLNDVVSADETCNTYVIENADSSITSLQSGDVFAYPYTENDVLIVKVASIETDGTTVTIVGEDTSMEDVFDYVKIDTEVGSGEATVDTSTCDEGVTYEGLVDYVEEDAPQAYGLDAGGSIEKAFQMKFDKKFGSIEGINVNVSGGLDMKLTFSAKVYLSTKQQYVECKLDYSAKLSAAVTGKASVEIPLITVGFLFNGIIVELTPSVVIDAKATISVSGTLSGTVGFRAIVGSGITNLTTTPKFQASLKAEGSIFVGFSLEPRIKILSDKVASTSLTAKVGAEVSASLNDPLAQGGKKKHTCTVCIAGDVKAKFKISAELKLVNTFKFTITPVDNSIKIADFYYSADHDAFGWSTCPYYLYQGKVVVVDSVFQPIQDVEITVANGKYVTDAEGKAELWLSKGNHTMRIRKEGFADANKVLILKDGGESMLVVMRKADAGSGGNTGGGDAGGGSGDIGGDDGTDEDGQKRMRVSLGGWHSAAIMEAGELYLWGSNDYGQLGDGTQGSSSIPIKVMNHVREISLGGRYTATITEVGDLYLWGYNDWGQLGNETTKNSSVPIKVMSHVSKVSLGENPDGENHSAAITEAGDLYLWGFNWEGQLGDETKGYSSVPIKVMSHVREVSLGDSHSAAITEEGDLYLWGCNGEGQLGNGTEKYSSSLPIKVMSHVRDVSLGGWHSAAITEEGDLYLWGFNYYGQLGNGTTGSRNIPIKVMSHVREVSLGDDHSAAITEAGDLYLWGNNEFGQLGNGTKEDSSVPVKVMSNVREVSLGDSHSAAITEAGDLYLWGLNDSGQLGNGVTEGSSVPIKIEVPPITETASAYSLLMAAETEEEIALFDSVQNWNGTSFTALLPNETYNYYVMKSKSAALPFSSDNLLYIGQAVSDENGTLEAAFTMKEAYANAAIFAVPMHPIDLADANVTVSDLTDNGAEQFADVAVTYQGQALVEGVDYSVTGDYGVTQAGDYTLTVEGMGLYTGTVSVNYKVLPRPSVTGVSLNRTTLTLKEGETAVLTATITPADADNRKVSWSSSNPAAAIVENGKVTAVEDGSAVITVTTEDGHKTATCSVTVTCNHALEKVEAVAATCEKEGNIEYFICSKCGKKYADKAGTKEVTNVKVAINPRNHVKGATEIRGAVAATATKEGYTGDTYCKKCGAKLATGKKIPATGNTGNTGSTTPKNGWYEKNGAKYWYENGVKQGTEGRGKEIYDKASDAWYWLDAPNGVMATGKDVYQESLAGVWGGYIGEDGAFYGKWVRYDKNGHMVKGWQTTEAGTYFFDYTYGTMAKGYATIDGKEYYFNSTTGVLERTIGEVPEFGWKNIDGKDYWYENYIRQGYSVDEAYRGKEIYDSASDAWYWLDNIQGGAKAVSKDVYQESLAGDWGDYTGEDGQLYGKWVRYDENGHMVKGWQTTDAGTYFFDYTYGTMAKGYATIDGAAYYFDSDTGIRQ